MIWIHGVVLLLATFAAQTRCQQKCSDYKVSASQADYLLGHDVKLYCKVEGQADTKIELVEWSRKRISLGDDGREEIRQPVYYHYEGYPDFSEGITDYKERLTGEFRNRTHTLTLINATAIDADDHTWICIATTQNCNNYEAVPKAELKLIFTTPYLVRRVTEILVDGEKTIGTSYTKMKGQYLNVTCISDSDPKAHVQVLGVPNSAQPECKRLHDPVWFTGKLVDKETHVTEPQSWVCVTTVLIKTYGTFNVSCKAAWQWEVYHSKAYQFTFEEVLTTPAPYDFGTKASAAKDAAQRVLCSNICGWLLLLHIAICYLLF